METSQKNMVVSVSPQSSVPDLMTESELIIFLRIPEVSNAKDYSSVIKYLIRYRNLPRIHICKKLLFPKQAILNWIELETVSK